MFEKYDVNQLYIAYINVTYSQGGGGGTTGWSAELRMAGYGGYSYITILNKEGDKFIDLQNPEVKLLFEENSKQTSYVIEYMEPLNKYYTQDGINKNKVGKRKSLKIAKKNSKKFYRNMYK